MTACSLRSSADNGRVFSRGFFLLVGAAMLGAAPVARGGMNEMVEAFRNSDIRFARTESDVPFPALGWMTCRYYSDADFAQVDGVNPGSFREQELDAGLLMPVYIGKRDIYLAGLNVGYDRFDFKAANQPTANVLTLTPTGGWLRQLNPDTQVGGFVAPYLSTRLDGNNLWGTDLFVGMLGSSRLNDRTMLFYGGIYEYSFGDSFVYPYVGMVWLPDRHWSLSLVAPWPGVSYAPNDRLFFRVGFDPGGADWRQKNGGDEIVASFGSWNLTAATGYRLKNHFWLYGGVGFAGFRSMQITGNGQAHVDVDVNRRPMFTLSFQFRP